MKTLCAVLILLICGISAEDSNELPNVIAVVGQPFVYSVPRKNGNLQNLKVKLKTNLFELQES